MTQILAEGTIAPWLWNGSSYYQGPLIDVGLFAPAGTSLTGMPIQVLWTAGSGPYGYGDTSVTAAITINGTTLTLGGTSYHGNLSSTTLYPYTVATPYYQNITVANFNPFNDLPGNIAINSYSPSFQVSQDTPHGLGGSFDLIGPNANCNSYSGGLVGPSCQQILDGYYYVTSMGPPPPSVPGPVVGEGFAALAVALFIVVACCVRRKGNHHVATQGVQDGC
jgi:hypothetical protein